MNMTISFFVGSDVDQALRTEDRINGLHLQKGERSSLVYRGLNKGYHIVITAHATRAPELAAELVREGFLD